MAEKSYKKPRKKRHSIKRRLTKFGMFIAIASIALVSAVYMAYNTYLSRNHLAHELSLVGKVVAQRAAPGLAWDDTKTVTESLDAFSAKDSVFLVCVYDVSGKIYTKYRNNKESCPRIPSEKSDFKIISIVKDIKLKGELQGKLYITSDLRDVRNALPNYMAFSFIVICFSVGLAYMLSIRHQKDLSNPILHLREIMTKVTKDKTYNLKATKYQNDEIGDMADAFNKMLVVVHDSNEELERKVAERTANLENALKNLKDALSAKDNFLKNMSHEFKTPAYQILHLSERAAKAVEEVHQQFIQYSKGGKTDKEIAEIEKKLDKLCGTVSKLTLACETEARFIQNMSDLNSLTKNEIDYHIQTNDLHEIIEDTLPSFKKYSERIIYKSKKTMKCLCDKNKIKRVLEHLLANALNYAPESNVTISVEKVKYRTDDKKSRLGIRCSVSDKGPGIAENELEYIFENFVEGSRTKTAAGGRGAGLAICRGFINAQQGKIWAESSNNRKGATFHFILPLS